MTTLDITMYWTKFVKESGETNLPRLPYPQESFGDTDELANELGTLIVNKKKTATCSCMWEYEAEGSELPQTGHRSIVLDGKGIPLCIVETTNVEYKQFQDVDEQFSFLEGEGDLTLEYWRQEHWKYFARVLPTIGKQPSLNMPLVCEKFRVIFRW